MKRRWASLLVAFPALIAACSAAAAPTPPPSTLERSTVPPTSAAEVVVTVPVAEVTVLGADANPFTDQVGTWLGGDDPHVYPLPDGRQLWWLNDSFVPVDGTAPVNEKKFVRNVAFLRDTDGAMTMLAGTKSGKPWDFLAHPDSNHFHRFFWPLGGQVVGSEFKVFVAEMECNNPEWGICFRPIRVWLATYTWADMQLVDLQPAVNDGVRPVYGFSVTSDEKWTYLWGTGQQYFTAVEQGGSAQTFVARVPLGRLEAAPAYWDGSTWNADPTAAAAVVDHGSTDLRMGVAYADGRYIGVSLENDFFGDHFVVMSATAPEGPWTEVAVIPVPSYDVPNPVSYDAIPYPVPVDGRVAVLYSRNSTIEKVVFADPSVYRPVMLLTDIDW